MSLLINIPNRNSDRLIEQLAVHIGAEEIEVWPNITQPDEVEFALCWGHQHGSLAQFPNLKGIHSFGAGVDSILSDQQLPNVPVARIVDPKLAVDMAQYVSGVIQQHRLRLSQFQSQQQQQLWKPKSPVKKNRVGILGLGQLGSKLAEVLCVQGFDIFGWSQTEKQLPNVTSYAGTGGLVECAQQSDYLVCLLPLTNKTKSILKGELFKHMPEQSVVINVARGQHLVEEDLIDALDSGQLDFAYLDVFRQEPLPKQHDFWSHDKIQVTPHIAAVTSLQTCIKQIVDNYRRVKQGLDMMNIVDSNKGY